jgi:hypothetical protein
MNRATFLTAALAAGLLSFTAQAAEEHFQAKLNAASEVPPKTSQGTGELTATLDTSTKELTYKLSFSGLTGPATMAHFHGPAAAGANAGVAVPIPHPVSPVEGHATLTAAQITDLEAGKWYVNVHTAANPGGELRGQVTKGM